MLYLPRNAAPRTIVSVGLILVLSNVESRPSMKINLPILPIVFEINARRRTEPFRFRVGPFMVVVALIAVIVYICLPLSAADQRLMAVYEQLGNPDPKIKLTREQVVDKIGPPFKIDVPKIPNTCSGCTWIARFETPLSYRDFELNLSFDSETDEVIAWGLFKHEFTGLDVIVFRFDQLLTLIGIWN